MSTARKPGPRYGALLRLLRTADRIWNASRAFFGRWGLSPSQFNILNLVYGLPEGMTQTGLSRELLMHRSNVTGLVDRLEARGWVERCGMANDRRVCRVVLTGAGRRMMNEILPLYYAGVEAVWGEVPVAEVERLSGHLERVAAGAERAERDYRGEGKRRCRRGED